MNLDAIIKTAANSLTSRQQYARDVICGYQRWSGADLKGKAKKFGASYARQRAVAEGALRSAGGMIVAVDRGLRVSAVPVGMDDYGNQIFATTDGVAVQTSPKTAKLVAA